MAENGDATIIGSDSHFKGELNFNSSARIDGKFEGQISGKGELQVANGAQCKADVAVGSALIDGTIQGNLKALEVVRLNADGIVRGDITAAKMVMTEGASFYGKCAIGAENGSSAKGDPAQAAHAATAAKSVAAAANPQPQPQAIAAGKK